MGLQSTEAWWEYLHCRAIARNLQKERKGREKKFFPVCLYTESSEKRINFCVFAVCLSLHGFISASRWCNAAAVAGGAKPAEGRSKTDESDSGYFRERVLFGVSCTKVAFYRGKSNEVTQRAEAVCCFGSSWRGSAQRPKFQPPPSPLHAGIHIAFEMTIRSRGTKNKRIMMTGGNI